MRGGKQGAPASPRAPVIGHGTVTVDGQRGETQAGALDNGAMLGKTV